MEKFYSERYLELNARLHLQDHNYGSKGGKRAEAVRKLAKKYSAASILDYGCGKGSLGDALGPIVRNYDPAIPEFRAPPDPAHLVVCLDVMEHIEPDFVDNVLDHIKFLALKAAYFIIVFHPSKEILPDGSNCHVCVEGKSWWEEKLETRFDVCDRFISEKEEGFYEVVPKRWKSV